MRFPLPITNAVLKITNGAMEFKSEDIGTIKLTKATFHLKKDTSLTTPEGTTLLSGGTLTLSYLIQVFLYRVQLLYLKKEHSPTAASLRLPINPMQTNSPLKEIMSVKTVC